MSGVLFNAPRFTPVNASGRPYAGAKLHVCRAGTTTLVPIYANAALTTTLPNPLTANSAGQFPSVYLDPTTDYDYKFVWTTNAGAQLGQEDNVPANPLTQAGVGFALYRRSNAEISADVTPSNYAYPPVDVRRYGAVGDGVASDSAAFAAAMSVAAQGGGNVFVPAGSYRIKSELAFPDNYMVIGEGKKSRLLLDLSAGQYGFKYSSGGSINSWGFEKLYFGIYPGGENNVCAIGITSGTTLRGAILRDLYGDELHRVLKVNKVYGSLTIDNISFKLSTEDAATGNIAVDLDSANGEANAIYMNSIELLGRFDTGIKWSGTVMMLEGFNISGSVTSTAELGTAIHVVDGRSFAIRNGYIEKMKSRSVAYEGLTTGNGSALSILIKRDASAFSDFHGIVENINMATGSVYVDGALTDVSLRNIDYAEANGGLRVVNGAEVNAHKSALKIQTNDEGRVRIMDPDSARGMYFNPTLRSSHPFTVIGGASLSDEPTDYVSGNRSVKVTPATTFEGVTAAFTLPKAGQRVTVVAKVKAVTTGDVRLDATGDTSSDSTGVLNYITPTAGAWHVLALTCSSSTTTLNVRLRNSLNDVFLIDSIQVYYGVATFDPSKEPDLWGTSAPPTYAASNVTTDRTYDANSTNTDELADVLGTLIADLRASGIVQ